MLPPLIEDLTFLQTSVPVQRWNREIQRAASRLIARWTREAKAHNQALQQFTYDGNPHQSDSDWVPFMLEETFAGGPLFLKSNRLAMLQTRTADALRRPRAIALFGGGVRPGETILAAFHREMGEELSLDIAESAVSPRYLEACVLHGKFVVRAVIGVAFRTFPASLALHEGDSIALVPENQLSIAENILPRSRADSIAFAKCN